MPAPVNSNVMCPSGLEKLAEYAKNCGAHAPLKPQPKGFDTLFVCVDEATTSIEKSVGATSWNHVITVDGVGGCWKVRFSSSKITRLLTTKEVRDIICRWVVNPSDTLYKGYENT